MAASMKVGVVVGNPNPGGRTTRVAQAAARAVVEAIGADGRAEVETIELAYSADRLFAWEDDELAALCERVASSTLIVPACPVYKASYTGLLKAFFDRYGSNGLAGVVALPVMLGAAPQHALAIETHFRPLLVELGASVPSRGLYVLESQLEDLDAVLVDFMSGAGPLLRRALAA